MGNMNAKKNVPPSKVLKSFVQRLRANESTGSVNESVVLENMAHVQLRQTSVSPNVSKDSKALQTLLNRRKLGSKNKLFSIIEIQELFGLYAGGLDVTAMERNDLIKSLTQHYNLFSVTGPGPNYRYASWINVPNK